MEERVSSWHISKSINITVLFGICIQTLALVWYAAKFDSRVANIEEWIRINADTQIKLERLTNGQDNTNRRLDRIETLLTRGK